MFDLVVRFYIDYVVWPTHKYSVFDFKSVANTLLHILVFLVSFIVIFNLINLFVLGF